MNPYEHLRVSAENSKQEVIVPIDPVLKIREELVGPHAINPLVQHNSSARSYMFTAHQSQSVTLVNGDTPILQTGVDSQLSEHTFGVKVPDYGESSGVKVLKVINRYDNISGNYASDIVEKYIITLREELGDPTTGESHYVLDLLKVPTHHTGLHQNFGFSYIQNEDVLSNLRKGTVLPSGTKLATSPSVRENGDYALGVNANMLLCSHPDIAEDSVIISESLAKKMRYHVFEVKAIEFGSEYLPLNLYGDDENYKPFPEIGDMIGEHSVLAALRNFKDFSSSKGILVDDPKDFSPALLSNYDLRHFDTIFDKCTYVRGPGCKVDIGNGETEDSGVVIDIKCYRNLKQPNELYYGMDKYPEKYSNSYIKFSEEVLKSYHKIVEELGDRDYGYGQTKILKTPALHNFIVNAGKIVPQFNTHFIKSNITMKQLSDELKRNKESSGSNLPNKLTLSNRNEILDTYRVEFTIRYTVTLTKGHKISDQSGGKGVISEVRPDRLMPYNEYGRVDIIMDSGSVISRTNMGRLYQHYFGGASRYCQYILRQMANNVPVEQLPDDTIEAMFTYLMGFLGKFDTPQFDIYATSNIFEKREIIKECIEEEVKIMYQVSNKKLAYQIVADIEASEYAPPRTHVTIPYEQEDGSIKYYVTKDKILVAPLYTLLICKTADNMLFTSSPNLNNFLFPISVTSANRDQMPYRNTPTKIISETEGRLYSYYAGREAMAELKDRANSVPTHKALYDNILHAPYPTNIQHAVDRSVTPYGNDSALRIIDATLRQIGMKYTYVDGEY